MSHSVYTSRVHSTDGRSANPLVPSRRPIRIWREKVRRRRYFLIYYIRIVYLFSFSSRRTRYGGMIDNGKRTDRRTDDNGAFGPQRYRVLILYDTADGCNNYYYYYRYRIQQSRTYVRHNETCGVCFVPYPPTYTHKRCMPFDYKWKQSVDSGALLTKRVGTVSVCTVWNSFIVETCSFQTFFQNIIIAVINCG